MIVKKAEYRIVASTNGFPELEKKVSAMLNHGWKPVGGLSFNAGYPLSSNGESSNSYPKTKEMISLSAI